MDVNELLSTVLNSQNAFPGLRRYLGGEGAFCFNFKYTFVRTKLCTDFVQFALGSCFVKKSVQDFKNIVFKQQA